MAQWDNQLDSMLDDLHATVQNTSYQEKQVYIKKIQQNIHWKTYIRKIIFKKVHSKFLSLLINRHLCIDLGTN